MLQFCNAITSRDSFFIKLKYTFAVVYKFHVNAINTALYDTLLTVWYFFEG